MKRFRCECGQRVFFDNTTCLYCARALGFDLDSGTLRVLDLDEHPRRCRNFHQHGNCNWLAEEAGGFCLSCGLNEVIPNLETLENRHLWTRVEQAKRRLLYTLLQLRLPIRTAAHGPGLRFRVLEDQRRNPEVFEEFVLTGHASGTITVNLAEADDAERHASQHRMQERYRTVLGHLRHEAGHHYFGHLTVDPQRLEQCRLVFGDERVDYQSALRAYYDQGGPPDWSGRFISSYASAHPMEDFAETFAHYLHIVDALETAAEEGIKHTEAKIQEGWIEAWIELSVTLNELNRSLGVDDPYPFVLTDEVIVKLELIDRFVRPAA